jgi:hypothetical protein
VSLGAAAGVSVGAAAGSGVGDGVGTGVGVPVGAGVAVSWMMIGVGAAAEHPASAMTRPIATATIAGTRKRRLFTSDPR